MRTLKVLVTVKRVKTAAQFMNVTLNVIMTTYTIGLSA